MNSRWNWIRIRITAIGVPQWNPAFICGPVVVQNPGVVLAAGPTQIPKQGRQAFNLTLA
jgi:hypothetical protein